MKRILLSAFAGAVVYFVWQMLTWMMIPLHGPTVSSLPDEAEVRDLLIEQNVDSGVYIVPFGNDDEDMMDPESEFYRRHREGPLFSIYYHRDGLEPMMTSLLIFGFLLDFIGVALASTLLNCASDAKCFASYKARVGFVTGLGVFLGLMGHVAYYNWMHFEAYYTAMFVVDAVVGWFLVGLIVAAIIKPTGQPAPVSSLSQ